jgi:putative nucleotidyltransferase with HDIG domain
MTRNEYLDNILGRMHDIPTLPTTVIRVTQMIEDPLCSSGDLARIILQDPAMAAKILKLANSAYYGFRQKIASVPQAISLLGFSTLKNTLLSAAVFDLFRLSASGFDVQGLWKHSVATAAAAKLLAKRVRYPSLEKAYTAGLLHDLGKVLIARYLPKSLVSVMRMVREEQVAMYDAEAHVIGLAHPAFAGWVMSRWGMPSQLIEAVEFHHQPTRAEFSFDLAAIVYIADIIAHRAGIGNSGDEMIREIDPVVREHLRINETLMLEVQDSLQFLRVEIEAFAEAAA